MRTAILGASGLVGRAMLELLARQPWIVAPPLLWTGARSQGSTLPFRDRELVCRPIDVAALDGVALALFSAGAAASRQWAPIAADAGAWVVDNSSAWRGETGVALIVPEVNGRLVRPAVRDRLEEASAHARAGPAAGGIIANPNCSTIQIALPCAALDQAAGLREVHVTTMQSVSGAGRRGISELCAQAAALAAGPAPGAGRPGEIFARRVAANVVPQIGDLGEDGFFAEEQKVHRELRTILDRSDLEVTCTATRVPVWNGHAAALRVVLDRPIAHREAVEALDAFDGLACHPDPGGYRTPAEVTGESLVHVGRLRHQPGRRDVLLFWVVADNLLKGAAWNAVQIAALLCGEVAR